MVLQGLAVISCHKGYYCIITYYIYTYQYIFIHLYLSICIYMYIYIYIYLPYSSAHTISTSRTFHVLARYLWLAMYCCCYLPSYPWSAGSANELWTLLRQCSGGNPRVGHGVRSSGKKLFEWYVKYLEMWHAWDVPKYHENDNFKT